MKLVALIVIFLACCACGREFLEVKRNKSQVVPSTVADFQSIIDRWPDMNLNSSHTLSIVGSDEYYITDDAWQLLSEPYQKNGYIWSEDPYGGEAVDDWDGAYFRILMANMVLEGVEQIEPMPDEQESWNIAKGSALFFRAWSYYQLTQVFCKAYDPATASVDLGLPLRLETDVSTKVGRATVDETYRQVIGDLVRAADLLPQTSVNKMRPSKPAALALLARVSLVMGDYQKAKEYAGQCLELEDGLLDFNLLNLDANQLLPLDYGDSNPEVLFMCAMSDISITSLSRFHADSTLLAKYDTDDLRLKGYFRDIGGGRMVFKGSYLGNFVFFTGLATDELYLILAECHARDGNLSEAQRLLNILLEKRLSPDGFAPLVIEKQDELIRVILDERRKELVLRGVRWEDLRRLNGETEYETTLKRRLQGTVHELAPESPRWVWPLPDNEIELAGLSQNR